MKTLNNWLLKCMPAGLLLLFSSNANAIRLEVAPDAAPVFHIAAALLLYSHIGAGTVGLVSGVIASLSRKGKKLHRIAGKTFFISMCICYLIGALVSPFLAQEQRLNTVAAILSLYLLTSGVRAANKTKFVAGTGEKLGFVIALSIVLVASLFMYIGAQHPQGLLDGVPSQTFMMFIILGGLAACGELNVIIRKKLSAKARIVRHVWRISVSFFIASGSLFFGQAKFFPDWFNASVLPILFGLFPVVILLIGIIQTVKPVKYLSQRFLIQQNKIKQNNART